MVLVAVNRILRERGDTGLPDLLRLLDLVALATVCDVVPLTGLNRAFVLRGLEVARRPEHQGMAALALASRVTGPLNPYHLGFLLGPRINAGGRIGDAALGTRLLTLDDEHQAMVIAAQLEELNQERQRIEIEAVEEAVGVAEAEIGGGEGPPVLVLASANWHRASSASSPRACANASSARALPSPSTPTAPARVRGAPCPGRPRQCGDRGGGAGPRRARWRSRHGRRRQPPPRRSRSLPLLSHRPAATSVGAARAASALKIDAALTARGASVDLLHTLEKAGPFGAGNPSPVFAFPAHRARYPQIVGKGGHVSFTLSSDDGAKLKAIAFRAAGTPLGETLMREADQPLHFAGTLALDHYQGREQVQLRLSTSPSRAGEPINI